MFKQILFVIIIFLMIVPNSLAKSSAVSPSSLAVPIGVQYAVYYDGWKTLNTINSKEAKYLLDKLNNCKRIAQTNNVANEDELQSVRITIVYPNSKKVLAYGHVKELDIQLRDSYGLLMLPQHLQNLLLNKIYAAEKQHGIKRINEIKHYIGSNKRWKGHVIQRITTVHWKDKKNTKTTNWHLQKSFLKYIGKSSNRPKNQISFAFATKQTSVSGTSELNQLNYLVAISGGNFKLLEPYQVTVKWNDLVENIDLKPVIEQF